MIELVAATRTPVVGTVSNGARDPWQVAHRVDDLPRVGSESPALPVQSNATTAAIEKPEAEFCLESGDLSAHAGLRQPEAFCGAGYARGLGDSEKSLQIVGMRHERLAFFP